MKTEYHHNFCIGCEEFVQNYFIPAFKDYIDSHPKCAEIYYLDTSIQCKLLGVNDEL